MSDRNAIRAAIFSAENKRGKRKLHTLMGQELEIRQPTVGQLEIMMKAQEDQLMNIVPILLEYAYVPGTDELVFESTDADLLRAMPYDNDCQAIVDTLRDFINLDVEEAAKN